MTKNKECAETEERWWRMSWKQNMWQLFSSPKRTLAPEDTENVCTTVDPQVDVSRTLMTARYLYLDLDLLTQSHHLYNIYINTSHPPPHCTLKKTHSLPQRQDMNVSLPPQQFSFNGPPDNLLFSSVLLVWPLAQSLPQLSAKTQDLSPLSGGGGCKEKKEKNLSMPLVVSLESWTYSKVFC